MTTPLSQVTPKNLAFVEEKSADPEKVKIKMTPSEMKKVEFAKQYVTHFLGKKESALAKDPYLKLVSDLEMDPLIEKDLVKHLMHEDYSSVYELSMLAKKQVPDTDLDFPLLSPRGYFCTLIQHPPCGKEVRPGSMLREHQIIDMHTCKVIGTLKNCARSYYIPGHIASRMVYITRNDCATLQLDGDSFRKIFEDDEETLVLYDLMEHRDVMTVPIPKSSIPLERRVKADSLSFTVYVSFFYSNSYKTFRTYSEHSALYANCIMFGETYIMNGEVNNWYMGAIFFKQIIDDGGNLKFTKTSQAEKPRSCTLRSQ